MCNGTQKKETKPLILMVDDLPKNLQVLGSILREKDYRISAAVSGKQALEMLPGINPDLILLDIMMPDMDGFEVCRQIKKIPASKDIPIIFLTAKTEHEDILKGFSAGGIDYITKPFNAEELLARAGTHIQLKQARDREKELIAELQNALAKVKLLSGLLPMCSNCKMIRDDAGYWRQVEDYLSEHSEAQLSHSLCPNCVQELYPDLAEKILKRIQ